MGLRSVAVVVVLATVAGTGITIPSATASAEVQPAGITWSQPTRVAGNGYGHLQAVSCPSATDCIAMDSGGDTVTWDGGSWSRPRAAITGASGIVSLSCPSTAFCAAAGTGTGLWTGHGTEWTRNGPAGTYYWSSVSCTSATFCAAATGDGYVSVFNGHAWSAPLRVDADAPDNMIVSCSSATLCFAMGGYGEYLEDLVQWNGSTWKLSSLSASLDKYATLACAPTGFCLIDDAGKDYTFSGSSWKASGSGPSDGPGIMSCTSATFCMLLTGKAYLYTGSAWRQVGALPVTVDPGNLPLYFAPGLACSRQSCAAVAGAPHSTANTYRSGGWGKESSVDNSGELDSVSCQPSGFCATAGMSWDAVVRQSGGHWGQAVAVSGAFGISGVSCTSAVFCLAVNRGGYAWQYNGTNWARAPSLADITSTNTIQVAVSCATPRFCVSAGDGLAVFNGSGWTKPVNDGYGWTAVSCSLATVCLAVDELGSFSVFNGTRWSAPRPVPGTPGLSAVSCVSATFCAAVGYWAVATFNGASWTVTNLPHHALTTVSCASYSSCLTVDQANHVFAFNGSGWSAAGSVPARTGAVVTAISCGPPTLCVAVDSLGDVISGT